MGVYFVIILGEEACDEVVIRENDWMFGIEIQWRKFQLSADTKQSIKFDWTQAFNVAAC